MQALGSKNCVIRQAGRRCDCHHDIKKIYLKISTSPAHRSVQSSRTYSPRKRNRLHATNQKPVEETSEGKKEGFGPSGIPPELAMFIVAAFWGSNPVCLRYVYMLDAPPSPATLGAIQSLAGAILLSIVAVFSPKSQEPSSISSASQDTGIMQALDSRLDNVWKAGAEAGLWTFVANICTISGFQLTSVSRGAFLIRLTVAFTPVVAKLTGSVVSNKEWAAAAVGVLGGILISLDSTLSSASRASTSPVGIGDAILIFGAFIWSIQTVRIGRHALRFDINSLARNQIATMSLFNAVWLATSFGSQPGSNPAGNLFAASTSPIVLLAAIWPGIGPWGIATALQVKAQSVLSASKTNIILATDTIWATAFATLLGSADEGLGLLGYAGAACLLLASAGSAIF